MLDQINKMAVQAQRAAERSGSRSQSRKRSYKPKRYKTVDRTRNKYNVKLNKNLAPISETINSMLFTSSNYRSHQLVSLKSMCVYLKLFYTVVYDV